MHAGAALLAARKDLVGSSDSSGSSLADADSGDVSVVVSVPAAAGGGKAAGGDDGDDDSQQAGRDGDASQDQGDNNKQE
jgi:hypothetical protein